MVILSVGLRDYHKGVHHESEGIYVIEKPL